MPKREESIAMFLTQACEPDPTARHMTSELYAAYTEWGERLFDKQDPRTWHFRNGLIAFGVMLARHGVEKTKYCGYSMWLGYRIKPCQDVATAATGG